MSRRGSRGSVETGAKVGMRDRSGGVLFLPLSFLVFLVLGAGDTQEGSDGEENSETSDKIILNIPDVIRTGIMLYNMNPEARPHTQYDN